MSGFDLDVGGTVKFGTASASKGPGGKSDYALQASIGRAQGQCRSPPRPATFVGKQRIRGYKNSAFATFRMRTEVEQHLWHGRYL